MLSERTDDCLKFFVLRLKMLNNKSKGNLFLLCLSKKRESPTYLLFVFVLCQGFVGLTEVGFSHMH